MFKKISFILLLLSIMNSQAMAARPNFYTELLNYIVPSPDQAHTDNCLYMASTGAAEILANRHYGISNPSINSVYDLSEIYALRGPIDEKVSWMETPVLRFNSGAISNKDLPYSGRTFWKRSLPSRTIRRMPTLKTDWFLKAQNGKTDGRFDVDVFTRKDVELIKQKLYDYRAPVVLIYRTAGRDSSYGYWNTWHTVTLVGYDDNMEMDEECPIAKGALKHIGSSTRNKIRKAMRRNGGCRTTGGFYVRDSEEPVNGASRVPRYVTLSYDDVLIMGTNAMSVYTE